jgi:hypothetical protein
VTVILNKNYFKNLSYSIYFVMSHEPYSISGKRDVQSVYCSVYYVYFVHEAKSQAFKGPSLLLIHVLD